MNRLSKAIAGIAAALVLSTALAGTALAGGGYRPHPGMGFDHPQAMERMAKRLDLTATQQEQIRAILESHRPQIRSVHERIREQRKALADASSNGFDENAVRAEADVLGDLVAEAAVLMSRVRADINEVLTPEQREKLKEFQQRAYRKHERRQR